MQFRDGPIAISALIIFSAWLFIGLPWLYVPSERIQYYENTQASPQPSTAKPDGSAQTPFFVQVMRTPKSAEERTQEARDREEKRSSDRWLVRWTAALFAATVGLILATSVLGILGWHQIRDNRKVIKFTRDEFDSTYRPKIRVKHLVLVSNIWNGESIKVDLTCVNTGTSEAFLQEIGIHYLVVKSDRPLPIQPAISATHQFGGARLECGKNWPTKDIDNGTILTPAEITNIREGRSKLYCAGYVSYLDAAERMRITGFCRVLTFPSGAWGDRENCRFLKFSDQDYEYED